VQHRCAGAGVLGFEIRALLDRLARAGEIALDDEFMQAAWRYERDRCRLDRVGCGIVFDGCPAFGAPPTGAAGLGAAAGALGASFFSSVLKRFLKEVDYLVDQRRLALLLRRRRRGLSRATRPHRTGSLLP
jgi:hypothetical protein